MEDPGTTDLPVAIVDTSTLHGDGFTRRELFGGAAVLGAATIGAAMASSGDAGAAVRGVHRQEDLSTTVAASGTLYDVIVIGAGLAGLSAATEVKRAGRSVLVVEARDRVGGRTHDVSVAPGVLVEMGGEWTGPGQTSVMALAKELGIKLFPAYSNGKNLYYRNGKLQTYTGLIPPTSSSSSAELDKMIVTLNQMAKGVSATAPWSASAAGDYDVFTVANWIATQNYSADTTFLAGISVRGIYGEETSQISLMDLLGEITGVGGDLLTAVGSAQSTRFVGGPQQLSEGLARRLTDSVLLNSPVFTIHRGKQVSVFTTAKHFRARQLIVTVPKSITTAIRFEPALPPAYLQYFQRQPTGATVKIQTVYESPFWRAQGLSGSVISDTGPIEIVYDNSPDKGSAGVLVGFAEGNQGRSLFGLTAAQRETAVLASLARYFGQRAAHPTHYVDMVWAHEPYSGGAYGSFNPPGVITSLAKAVHGPVGNIRFAGADYSPEWPGYMEGAIRSGTAAAKAALAAL